MKPKKPHPNQRQPKVSKAPGPRPAHPITFLEPKGPNNPPPDLHEWPVLWPLTEEVLRLPYGRPPSPTDTPPPAAG